MTVDNQGTTELSETFNGTNAGGPIGPLARVGIVNLIRLTFGVFGIAGLGLGAYVAWQAESATTLLIVSALLLVLGALGLEWSEIRGTYGGVTLAVLRNVEARIEKVTATAADDGAPAAVREELESIRTEIKALAQPANRPRPKPLAPSRDMDSMFRELFRTKAAHSFQGKDTVKLSLRIASNAEARYRCTVKTPSESSFNAVARRQFNPGFIGVNEYTVVYPDEVPDSEPLIPGRYEVEWRPAPLVDPMGANALQLSLAQTMTRPAATDSFTIPEGTKRGEPTPSTQ